MISSFILATTNFQRPVKQKNGTHVNSWLIHVNVWQKPLPYSKVISLQLIKIDGKKNVHAFEDCSKLSLVEYEEDQVIIIKSPKIS